MYSVIRSKTLFPVAVMLLSIFLVSLSCNAEQKDGFGIYLADSGELLLSEHDIKAFYSANNTFELNENGIDKWNSHLTSQTTPKLADSLFSREFVIRIEGQEICRGKFWLGVSSKSYSGIVILDALVKLNSDVIP